MSLELNSPPLAQAADDTPTPRTFATEHPRSLLLSGRLVSFRLVVSTVWRRKALWMVTALLGLVIGTAYHILVPPKYAASATIYVAHTPGSDDSLEILNDTALLQTEGVTQRADQILGERLSTSSLLGSNPVVSPSDNILQLSLQAPSASEARRRVAAVTTAYLDFRAQQYRDQSQAIVAGLNRQISSLEGEINSLSAQISSAPSGSSTLTQLASVRGADTTALSSLQQQVQQENLNTIAVNDGSRVLTPATVSPLSKTKLLALDGLSGLGIGLALGIAFIALQALLSDKVRRREDVAAIIGAPVEMSLNRKKSSKLLRPFRSHDGPSSSDSELVTYLRKLLSYTDSQERLLIVTMDDTRVPTKIVVKLAEELASEGRRPAIVDLTRDAALSSLPNLRRDGVENVEQLHVAAHTDVPVFSPPGSVSPEEWGESQLAEPSWRGAGVLLALATIDSSLGAWHLAHWGRAVVIVTAGRCSAQRLSTISQLLRAAELNIPSTLLLNAEPDDDSPGLLDLHGPSVKASASSMPEPRMSHR